VDQVNDDQQPADPATDQAPHAPLVSRRRLLTLAGAGVVGVAGAGSIAGYAVGRTQERRRVQQVAAAAKAATPPVPPLFTTVVNQPGQAAGDIFITDMGDTAATLIADGAGNSLWSSAGAKSYANMRLQTYQGRPVITWWESHSTGLAAYAEGQAVIEDVAHNVITRVQKHGDVSPDEHEFSITPRGTAYIVSYVKTKADLRSVKGPKDGLVMNGIFEEIDLATGKVLHHWESLDHVALTESHAGVPKDPTEPYDYFHINSVAPAPDGNVIISARHTWTVYKVELATGNVRWRFGGKRSDFDLPETATFAWQHDAQFEDPHTLRMFDNGSDGEVTVTDESQVLWFSIDEAGRKARLVRRLVHPAKISAQAMGNAQRLDNGNLFVGWGTAKRISEFSDDGTLLFDATLPEVSYRAFRQVWR
jgi:uncharacterized protein YndB with AHSA1/START domain